MATLPPQPPPETVTMATPLAPPAPRRSFHEFVVREGLDAIAALDPRTALEGFRAFAGGVTRVSRRDAVAGAPGLDEDAAAVDLTEDALVDLLMEEMERADAVGRLASTTTAALAARALGWRRAVGKIPASGADQAAPGLSWVAKLRDDDDGQSPRAAGMLREVEPDALLAMEAALERARRPALTVRRVVSAANAVLAGAITTLAPRSAPGATAPWVVGFLPLRPELVAASLLAGVPLRAHSADAARDCVLLYGDPARVETKAALVCAVRVPGRGADDDLAVLVSVSRREADADGSAADVFLRDAVNRGRAAWLGVGEPRAAVEGAEEESADERSAKRAHTSDAPTPALATTARALRRWESVLVKDTRVLRFMYVCEFA